MEADIVVYVVNINKMFMAGGEKIGRTYSLHEFEIEFNSERINPETDVIRFITNKNKNKKKSA